jgi:hypothetical protein
VFGQKPVKLRTSKCFPICLQKQTFDLRVYEYMPQENLGFLWIRPGRGVSLFISMSFVHGYAGVRHDQIGIDRDLRCS